MEEGRGRKEGEGRTRNDRSAKDEARAKRDGGKRTLTTLSHPAETMTGFKGLGENRTQETLRGGGRGGIEGQKTARDEETRGGRAHHSECPSSLMSNLHSPRVFQSLMVRSRDPETICRLSAEKETLGGGEEGKEKEVSFSFSCSFA